MEAVGKQYGILPLVSLGPCVEEAELVSSCDLQMLAMPDVFPECMACSGTDHRAFTEVISGY